MKNDLNSEIELYCSDCGEPYFVMNLIPKDHWSRQLCIECYEKLLEDAEE